MLTLQNIPTLLQHNLMDYLLSAMEETFPEYVSSREKKEAAIKQLDGSISHATISIREDEAAIMQQIASTAFFSALLGLKANLDNYIDPVKTCFLDVDPEIYLREAIAHNLLSYSHAETIRNQFYDTLTPEEQNIYAPIQDYACCLETITPKLAHYFGYILGNYLLPKVIPGYVPDNIRTIQYQHYLSRYFSRKLPF